MIFEYFGCLGTSPGGLGAHFEPKARISVISETFVRESPLFEVKMHTFWIHFLVFFLSAVFICFFMILGVQSIQNGLSLIHI